ncbi:LuxR C-terminal-related transcriptional regulator [Streptomyces sp. NBC_01498]|uniref:LuxR C-terminal-related transcriptional regulator n=1 Tax=Streptomyces sp. NBC_01498 TaxID=2975870 RepID=UPI002E7BF2C0|nr:LuxR C-terminal-related transcriptional regulator [Streptomyces sp. NBC_01498]WTL28552.1 LuxR C-terminal-related transcriptional regulator [Streptomyces sp. NBC_01498]
MSDNGERARLGRILDEAVRVARAARTVEGMFAGVMRAVTPVLPSDVWAGVTVDPWTLMNTGGDYRDGVPARLMPRMLDIEYREGDVNSLPELARRPVPVGLLSQESGGRPERSPRYRDIMGPLGQKDELRVVLRDSRDAWGALIIGVGDTAPVGPDVLALAGALSRPLGEELRRIHLIDRVRREPSPASPALVLLDSGYRALHLTSSAAAWFDDLLPHARPVRRPGSSRRPPADLPPAVYAVAAAVRAPGAADSLSSLLRSRSRGLVRLHAWRLGDQPPATVAVSIEPAGPGEHAAHIVAAYALTRRERDIVSLVLRGHSTAAISQQVRLSPHTVQDHLKSIFDKTGVRSRRDLVATLFARHYQPGLIPPVHGPDAAPRPRPPAAPGAPGVL